MINIYPIGDTCQHVLDTTCACLPVVYYQCNQPIVKHNSFDGREAVEWAQEILESLPIIPSLNTINLRALRKKMGLTLRQVEEHTGVSNAYLSQLETGKITNPSYETVRILFNMYSQFKHLSK